MEATALSLGKAVLGGALSYAKSKAAEEVALQLGVEDDVTFITDELQMMQSFLMTADEERSQTKVVTTWVTQVRDLAYNVEDSLMDFGIDVGKKPIWGCIPRSSCDRRRIAKEVKKLRSKVEDVSNRNLRYRLIKDGSRSKPAGAAEQTTASDGVERQKPKADLLQLVTSKEVDLRVVAVCGTTGDRGKTAAIHEVYDHPSVASKYGLRAWVRLIHPFNPEEFLRSMVRQFLENFHDKPQGGEEATNVGATVLLKMDKMNQSDLVHTFTTQLSSNSYLIVIDDLCTVEEWQRIRRFFPDNKKESRIIVSTQQVEVISEIQEEYQPPKSTGNSFSTSTTGKKFDRMRTMTLNDDVLVGRKTEKSEVIDLIGQPSDKLCKVISVWGMGGLGKTTLVRSIYRSQQLDDWNWKRAWVTATRPFDNEVLIRTLASQLLHDSNTANMKLDVLRKKIDQLLLNENYLIVLDDLSSIEEWNLVRDQWAKAKRIIVTTREYSVAKYCSGGDMNTHKLQVLQEEDALALFLKKVFNNHTENTNLGTDMLDQAALIIKKCHGLPLAISAIGGFLANKPKTATEWRKVNDRIRAELDMNPELRSIKTVLMRSYDGLPYHLKSAFLYMSIFPEDYKIKRKRLIRRWIAEGYCRGMHGMSAEEVGDRYFEELLDRSMILLLEEDTKYGGAIDSCQLHDIIREICILKAREENLAFTLEEGCCLSDAQGTIRHLAIGSNWKRDKDVLVESMLDLSHVRSLTVFGEWKPFFISDKMRFLRVLDLGDTFGLRDRHLDQIGQLLHLKIASFPSAITKLQKLEQLLASGADDGFAYDYRHDSSSKSCLIPDFENHLIYDPRSVSHDAMPRIVQDAFLLWHSEMSDGSRRVREYVPMRKNNCCTSLLYHIRMGLLRFIFGLSICYFCWRPEAMGAGFNRRDVFNFNMISTLNMILFGGVKAPRGIRKLKALHTLGVVDVSRSKTALKELEELTQLRKLAVAGVHSKYSNKFWSVISANKQLRSLSVKGLGLDSCFGGDLLPPIHLESLKLEGKLVRINEWIHKLQNLSKLQLYNTKIDSADPMQAIGQLPNLTMLTLCHGSFMDNSELLFHGPSSFPELMVLKLKDVDCEIVSFKEQAMPKLELIHADFQGGICGLAFLASLKEIRLGTRTRDTLKKDLQKQLTGDLERVSLKLL
ncbi:Disease resistance protein RPM1 [Zea mays]|uniref:Disease resistance protein RPM1 n=1 Tax=Zea mays TaxID=4577 RepID=A0A1D6IU36_MAIZE|nr:Disease resistance protein RPM1 [Zea mays]